MISAPSSRVEAPHDVCHGCCRRPSRSVNSVPNAFEKFWPSSWLVPICSALPSRITPSHVQDRTAPANFSRCVFSPVKTGIAMTSRMTSA